MRRAYFVWSLLIGERRSAWKIGRSGGGDSHVLCWSKIGRMHRFDLRHAGKRKNSGRTYWPQAPQAGSGQPQPQAKPEPEQKPATATTQFLLYPRPDESRRRRFGSVQALAEKVVQVRRLFHFLLSYQLLSTNSRFVFCNIRSCSANQRRALVSCEREVLS